MNHEVIVPEHHDVMGAIGIAILVKEEMKGPVGVPVFAAWILPGMIFTQIALIVQVVPMNVK